MPDLATSERTLRELEKRPSQHPQKKRLGRDTLGAFSARCPQTLFTAVCPQTPTSTCNFIGSCQARGQPCPSEAWKCLGYLPSLPPGNSIHGDGMGRTLMRDKLRWHLLTGVPQGLMQSLGLHLKTTSAWPLPPLHTLLPPSPAGSPWEYFLYKVLHHHKFFP